MLVTLELYWRNRVVFYYLNITLGFVYIMQRVYRSSLLAY